MFWLRKPSLTAPNRNVATPYPVPAGDWGLEVITRLKLSRVELLKGFRWNDRISQPTFTVCFPRIIVRVSDTEAETCVWRVEFEAASEVKSSTSISGTLLGKIGGRPRRSTSASEEAGCLSKSVNT